ncbi:ATP-binding protein [Frankia sp. R82]|uniref:ATP-binding protein n=1 Tax=Frankia sp. R82 TaxID=2950553 RepID=UPI002042D347|nr:ATP-binding protein [Frankia sp. R82]MCM3882312.1 ATP-binding protein [Frankia sp. R82]
MVALSTTSPVPGFPGARLPLVEDVAWFTAEEDSAAGAARRAAMKLADTLGFAAQRRDEIGIAVTEVATNLVRHAQGGRLLLRALRWVDPAPPASVTRPAPSSAVQVVALDSGPGIVDVAAAMRDGTSSAGTLGVGLGAIARLSDGLDLHSTPGLGTVMAVTFLPTRRPTAGGQPAGVRGAEPFVTSRIAGLTRPITGELVCGDACAVRPAGAGVAALLCDGLGHGELAARAATEAVRIFLDGPESTSPVDLVQRIHRGLAHTRGAAVTVVVLEPAQGTVRMAGVGNISGVVLSGTRRSGLAARPGIVGHQLRSLVETHHDLEPGSVLILHSDGVSPRFDLAAHPGVTSHGALLVAATVLRDAGLRRDDASVLVAITAPAPGVHPARV